MRVSVVVPTLNEAASIEEVLAALRGAGAFEVLVVDGGSSDGTAALAERADRVIVEPGGLAAQLNRGAREAQGEALLFLHADTRLPPGALEAVGRALEDPTAVGGAFRLAFESRLWRFRAVAAGANLRNRIGLGPFGDQAIFVRRDVFDGVGGYRPERYLEDLDLVRRLRRAGRFTVLDAAVRTSTRRWERGGFTRTWLVHLGMTAAYVLGKRYQAGGVGRILDALRRTR